MTAAYNKQFGKMAAEGSSIIFCAYPSCGSVWKFSNHHLCLSSIFKSLISDSYGLTEY